MRKERRMKERMLTQTKTSPLCASHLRPPPSPKTKKDGGSRRKMKVVRKQKWGTGRRVGDGGVDAAVVSLGGSGETIAALADGDIEDQLLDLDVPHRVRQLLL